MTRPSSSKTTRQYAVDTFKIVKSSDYSESDFKPSVVLKRLRDIRDWTREVQSMKKHITRLQSNRASTPLMIDWIELSKAIQSKFQPLLTMKQSLTDALLIEIDRRQRMRDNDCRHTLGTDKIQTLIKQRLEIHNSWTEEMIDEAELINYAVHDPLMINALTKTRVRELAKMMHKLYEMIDEFDGDDDDDDM